MRHSDAEFRHGLTRAAQRYGLGWPDIVALKEAIYQNKSTPAERTDDDRCVHLVPYQGKHVWAVYSRKTKNIVTLLPPDWWPKEPFSNFLHPEIDGPRMRYGGLVFRNTDIGFPISHTKMLLRKVKNEHKGYVWSWPKGGPDEGENPEDAATREVREETGWDCEIISPIHSVFRGLETVSKFWMMRPVKDHGDFGPETECVRWASFQEAEYLLGLTSHATGRERDLRILQVIRQWIVAKM